MWNYNFIIPNIVLLITFLIFYFLQPHIPISQNRSFLRVLFIEICVTFLDIFSSLCLENFAAYPILLHITLNTLFFLAFMFRSLFFFHFTISLFTPKSQRNIKLALASYSVFFLCEIIALANFFIPTLFRLDSSGYHRGEWYNIIYFCAFFYSALSFVFLFANRYIMRRRRFFSALAFNLVLFTGYVFRRLYPNYLLMDFFCTLSIIIMYLSFENSALYLEGRTNAFNLEALNLLLEERVGKSNSLILGILLHNYNDMREIYSGAQIDLGISLIAENLRKTYPDLSLFYIHSGRFILVGNSDERDADSLKKEIRARFAKPWTYLGSEMELYLDVRFVEVNSDFKITSAEQLLHGLYTAFNNVDLLAESDMLISDETIKIIASARAFYPRRREKRAY